jgi:putative PEP-CTERM system integral membrane protein
MMETTLQNPPKSYNLRDLLQYWLFWSWNLVFLAFMSLGFAPILLPEIITAVRIGTIQPSFLIYALVLASIPLLAVILGLTLLRRYPSRLFAMGYVIEGPLMLMLAVRFFLIRQATPGTTVMMGFALLGMMAFLWTLLDPLAGKRRPVIEAVRLGGLAVMALIAIYAAVWIAFYALPLSVEAWRGLVDLILHLPRTLHDLGNGLWDMVLNQPLRIPFSVLGIILLLYTGTLFVITPLAVPYLSLLAWLRIFKQQAGRLGPVWTSALTAGTLAACAGLFLLFNRQPQEQAFADLANQPATESEARTLLAESGKIRAGLLNAYLAPYRYISAQGEVRHVSDIYASTFHISQEKAFNVQRLYEGLAQPLLYQPVHSPDAIHPVDNHALVEEPKEAAHLYQSFFDTPISTAERPTIVRAARSTWSPDRAETAWQAVDDREVHLVRQELSVQEHQDWAEMELYEVYQNQTAQQQEVIYYFNLPESAVLTGIWLGNSPEKEYANSFQVAPRGAAQAVYREQTRQMKDPALLEQIGPRQYRLRVFPIQPLRTGSQGRLAG